MSATMNQDDVLQAVRNQLESFRAKHGISLDIMSGAVRRDGEWWYVPVRVPTEHASAWGTFDHLGDTEDELETKHDLKVLLVPEIG